MCNSSASNVHAKLLKDSCTDVRFEPYIGTLALASAASMEGQLSMHRMQVRQVKREVDLALRLVRLIEPLMVEDGDKDKIQADLKKEASCMLPLPAFTAVQLCLPRGA